MGHYLKSKKYKKVAYIGAPQDIMCSIKRSEGLQAYYEKQHIKLNPNYIIYIPLYKRFSQTH